MNELLAVRTFMQNRINLFREPAIEGIYLCGI